ncbi:1e31825c-585b-47cd-9acf-768d0dab139a [Sclerotinia trifoliorum]|uniref:1e31825c-585b-47cd-9acf-768d0dab139a n=1 Tax=Sclerotinia trifoliorum TaxID=28548 RepID=A0A8H2ZMR0_9HELO|nr:1e31825c-585b-47cd-9acf-768d0dab139a [Sclerotinia trifoliorum]
MQYTSTILMAISLITSVSAHGRILSPTPRSPGPAMQSACGQQVEGNQASDPNGNIQGMLQVANSQKDYNAAECNIWQCKGYKFADNKDKVQSWTAGQVVPFQFDVAAPHTGTANVSIVSTADNKVLKQLLYYDVFASTATGVKPNQTSFSITIPQDLGDQCTVAGACVVQHFWDARSIDQTYESCVDFTVGGSGSGSDSSSASASAGSSAAVSSIAASSSVPVVASSVSSVAAIVTSAAASSSIPVLTTSFAPLPTTLVTMTKASSTSSATAVASSAASVEDDDTCDA